MPKKQKKPPAVQAKMKVKANPAVGSGLDVLETSSAIKIGELANSVDFFVNLERVDTVNRMSSGTQPVTSLKDAVGQYRYVLPLGKNVPSATAPGNKSLDPRTPMSALKQYTIMMENVCEQDIMVDAKRPIANVEDPSSAAAYVDIMKGKVLKRNVKHTEKLDMTYSSVRIDQTVDEIYTDILVLLRFWRTDQLDDSLVSFDPTDGTKKPNLTADCVKVTLMAEYYGDSSARCEDMFFMADFAKEFPDPPVKKNAKSLNFSRHKPYKFANKAIGYTPSNTSPGMEFYPYDVSSFCNGLGFDRQKSQKWGKCLYVLSCADSDDDKEWIPFKPNELNDFVLYPHGAGGYCWDENDEDSPNIAGGVCVYDSAEDKIVMWDFARNQPVLAPWGYTAEDGFGEYRYGTMPSVGVLPYRTLGKAALAKIRGEEAPEALVSTLLLGLSVLMKLVTIIAEAKAAYDAMKQDTRVISKVEIPESGGGGEPEPGIPDKPDFPDFPPAKIAAEAEKQAVRVEKKAARKNLAPGR